MSKESGTSTGERSHFTAQIRAAQRAQQVTNLLDKCEDMSSSTKQPHKKLGMA